jgi:hypothetical protein
MVPVLWITAGFATTTVGRIIQHLRDSRLSFKSRLPLPLTGVLSYLVPEAYLMVEPDRTLVEFKWYGYFGPWHTSVLAERPGKNQVSAAAAMLFQATFVGAGLIAEILSLVALYSGSTSENLATVTFVCALVIVLLTALILAFSLGAVFTEVFPVTADAMETSHQETDEHGPGH